MGTFPYGDTAPSVPITGPALYSIRLVLGIVSAFDLELMLLDMKTAFLYGELDETIYMQQPEGFVVPGKEGEVCKLHRPINELKQAATCWNIKFNQFLFNFDSSVPNTTSVYTLE